LPQKLLLHNPSRIVPQQERFVRFIAPGSILKEQEKASKEKAKEKGKADEEALPDQVAQEPRYIPLLSNLRASGFLLLQDLKPDEPEEYVAIMREEKKEPAEAPMPEPFEWTLEEDDDK